MKILNILRLENEQGLSPYEIDINLLPENDKAAISNMRKTHDIIRPLLYQEIDFTNKVSLNQLNKLVSFRKITKKHYFKNKNDLVKWYGLWLKYLISIGFKIVKYDVDVKNIIFGLTQLYVINGNEQKNSEQNIQKVHKDTEQE